MLSGLYRILHRNALTPYTKYLHFCFEVSAHTTLSETMIANTLDVWILGSGASNLDRKHTPLLPFLLYLKYLNKKNPATFLCGVRRSFRRSSWRWWGRPKD